MRRIIKGSSLVLIGSVFFRVGGYIFRILMQTLLGIEGYGILSTVLSFQWILILIAAAGLPQAIAKFVSQHLAENNKFMVKQTIITSLKIMIPTSIICSIIFFYLAKILVSFAHLSPNETILFQVVGLITPFTVILGLFRGVFQGYQRMDYLLITRVVEQFFMILIVTILVLIGFGVLGAVIGSIIGFACASFTAYIIFKKKIKDDLKNVIKPLKAVNERKLAKKLLIFSIPIIITGIAELAIFDTGNFVIISLMGKSAVGYYNVVSPVARLPLIISASVAISMLPATSEALTLNNNNIIQICNICL
ncbi:MAG: flippase [Methanobacterium sp.]|nr:flippase [Methanobacterium sp.]